MIDLTDRQRDVVSLMAEGLSHKEAARVLGVSPNTVRRQVQLAITRTQSRNVVDLCVQAVVHGAIDVGAL